MRKEIARILSADAIAGFKASSNELAGQILSLLIEEIEKGLLTEKEIDIEARSRPRETWLEYGKDIAQAQLQKIIKRLEEK